METFPRVLVLLSVYNGEKYLSEQLESILRQQNVTVTIYIRDDGSQDNSEKIIQEYGKRGQIYVVKETNIGAEKSFMRLIELAPGNYDYYAYADQDDYWNQNKLCAAISQIEDSTEVPALYYSRTKRVGVNLETIANPYKRHYHTEGFPDVLIMTQASGCTMVFNGNMLNCLKRYTPTKIYMHDQWTIQVCAALGGKIVYDPKQYVLYRQHEDNVMGGLRKLSYNPLQLFIYRVHKFFDFSYKPSLVAAELEKGYSEIMDNKSRKVTRMFVNAPMNIKDRIFIFFSNDIKTPYRMYNLKFRVQVLINKI